MNAGRTRGRIPQIKQNRNLLFFSNRTYSDVDNKNIEILSVMRSWLIETKTGLIKKRKKTNTETNWEVIFFTICNKIKDEQTCRRDWINIIALRLFRNKDNNNGYRGVLIVSVPCPRYSNLSNLLCWSIDSASDKYDKLSLAGS